MCGSSSSRLADALVPMLTLLALTLGRVADADSPLAQLLSDLS